MKDLCSMLTFCKTEEEVKHEFAKFFKYKLDTTERIDLYSEAILYEFKYDVHMTSVRERAKIVAQALYYIRNLKYGNDSRIPSRWICGVDKNEAFLIEAIELKKYYYNSLDSDKYDWDLRPSYPDKKLIEDLTKDKIIKGTFIYRFSDIESQKEFIKKIELYRDGEQLSLFDDKKEITEYNFYPIFLHWKELFEGYVENGHKSSEYFVIDIEQGRTSILEGSQVLFRMTNGDNVTKYVPLSDYEHFWKTYSKVQSNKVIDSIRQKMDRMTETDLRRFTGEFFTPVPFAEKAIDYIFRVVGKKCWESGKYRLWDIAAGTGNLEYSLPTEALKYCYLSTLLEDDSNYCQKLYPDATVFQYDYLNSDISFIEHPELKSLDLKYEMPESLMRDLQDPDITWIIFFNPPYVTSNNNERKKENVNKNKVSMTKIQKIMTDEGLGETSRELVSQFLYRIEKEFYGKKAYIAMFSKLKYINSTNDQKLRDTFFKYKYEKGFVFSSKNFSGCKAVFPVGFIIWNISTKKELEKQKIIVDVYNEKVEKIGIKQLAVEEKTEFLSKWIDRERNVETRPPFSSAITVADTNKDRRDRVAKGFLASFMCKGNDYANQNYTSFLSSPYVSAGALSVTNNNFEKSMVVFVVRRLPKANWLNDRDQMKQPNTDVLLDRRFIADCVVWALFSGYNDTVSLKDVKYEGLHYRIKNEFHPFQLEDMRKWKYDNSDIKADVFAKHDDRFAAKWINKNIKIMSPEAIEVLREAKKLYASFYEHLNELPWPKYKVSKWDTGWWQIRMALGDGGIGYEEREALKISHKKLGKILLEDIYKYGFIEPDMIPLE